MKAKLLEIDTLLFSTDADGNHVDHIVCIEEFECNDENTARICCILKYGAKCYFHHYVKGDGFTMYRAFYKGHFEYVLFIGENFPEQPRYADGEIFLTDHGKKKGVYPAILMATLSAGHQRLSWIDYTQKAEKKEAPVPLPF